MRGGEDRMVREHNELISLAWHTVALDRQKRLPKLDRLLIKRGTTGRKRQTWQEQFAIMGNWIKALEARKKAGG